MRRAGVVTASLAVVLLVSGCSEFQDRFLGRYGPNPVPTADVVEIAAQRQSDIVIAMGRGAGLPLLPPSAIDRIGIASS